MSVATIIAGFICWLLIGITIGLVANARGRSFHGWFWWTQLASLALAPFGGAFFLLPFALALLLVFSFPKLVQP